MRMMVLTWIRNTQLLLFVWLFGLIHVGRCSVLKEFQECYENVVEADSNHDKLLDKDEFLHLVKFYNSTCVGFVNEQSSDVLAVFIQLSKCPCTAVPFADKSCCTEDSRISVPDLGQEFDGLTIFEKAGYTLLCMQASSLSNKLGCNDTAPTETRKSSSPESPTHIYQPTAHPTLGIMNKEITSVPTPSDKPLVIPPFISPTPHLASIPTAPPFLRPTNLPSLDFSARDPTGSTSPPTLPSVGGKEIPAPGPPFPFFSPTTGSKKPTNLPILEEPTNLPSITVDSVPTPISPPFESPTTEDALCINSMRMADSDGDKDLTFGEYVVFLQKFIQCTGILSTSSFVLEAFSLTRCFPNVIGCIAGETLDISPFYISTSQRKTIDDAEIIKVCEIAEGLKKVFFACVDLPTEVPTEVPSKMPEISTGETQNVPTASPLQVIDFPSKAPIDLPTYLLTEAPVPAPAFDTSQPESVQGPPTNCLLGLVLADSDSDSLLTQAEYLIFVSKLPGCEFVTALSSRQIETFNNLAALCLNEPDADSLCAEPRNARVSIDGYVNTETVKQRNDLAYVCAESEGDCAISQAPVDTPESTPFIPVAIPSQLPVELVQPTVVDTDATTTTPTAPTANAPALTQPDIPSTLPAKPPLVDIPIGTGSPVFSNDDNPVIDVDSSSPGTTQPLTLPTLPVSVPVTAPSLDSAVPPLGVEDAPPQDCIDASLESDTNQDRYLSYGEYLSFVQRYSNCDLINTLSSQQRAVFQNLACACLGADNPEIDCCLPGNAKVLIDESVRLPFETYSLAEICFLTAATFDDKCVASPTTSPIEYEHLDQCSKDLVASDIDKNDLMDKDEYLLFIQKFGQCGDFKSLDLGHYSVFQTMACECVNQGASFECCLPGSATLNISGASLQDSNRTANEISTLSKICITASGLTTRPCNVSATPIPVVDCADQLLSSDNNLDGFLDMEEYLYFLQATYTNCSEIEWLSLSQRVVFGLLACSCMLEPGAELECCFPGNARINITGARFEDVARSLQQSQFLSTLCTASNAAADIGCRTVPPTPAPTENFQLELKSPAAAATESSAEVVAVAHNDKVTTSESFKLQSDLSANWFVWSCVALMIQSSVS